MPERILIGTYLLIFIKALLKARIVAHEVQHGDLLIGVLQLCEKAVREICPNVGIKVDVTVLPLLHHGSPHKQLETSPHS